MDRRGVEAPAPGLTSLCAHAAILTDTSPVGEALSFTGVERRIALILALLMRADWMFARRASAAATLACAAAPRASTAASMLARLFLTRRARDAVVPTRDAPFLRGSLLHLY